MSKERILKVHLPLSRSTTSRSLSKPDKALNALAVTEPSVDASRTACAYGTVAGSNTNDSQLKRSMHEDDPFIVGEHPPLREFVAERDHEPERPLAGVLKQHVKISRQVWNVSPRKKSFGYHLLLLRLHRTTRKQPQQIFQVRGNLPVPKDVQDLQKPTNGASEVQNRLTAATKNSDAAQSTIQTIVQSLPQFPARVSSRKQFQRTIRDPTDRAQSFPLRQSSIPGISNRFDSFRSAIQSKASPASVSRPEPIRGLDYSTSTNGASSQRERRAPESVKAQLSATKGMLSNFRGMFHKRCLRTMMRSLQGVTVALSVARM